MKILFFGDTVGKVGRRALQQIIPEYKKEYEPDLVIVNAENIAHGIGMTRKTLDEIIEAGGEFFTGGNHSLKKPESVELLNDSNLNVIRPANFPEGTAGAGYKVIEVGSRSVLIINLMGRVFMKEEATNPFQKVDEILKKFEGQDFAAIIVDFHGEATSEKVAFGHYVDGRVNLVVGTHTHIPTADARVLQGGTAYVTDLGMVGASDSVIGDIKEPIIEAFLSDGNPKISVAETGDADVGCVYLEIDPSTKRILDFKRVDKKVKVL